MLLTMVVCNDMFLSCAMLLFELCLWLFGACSLSVLIEYDFYFYFLHVRSHWAFFCVFFAHVYFLNVLVVELAWMLFVWSFYLCAWFS
jgi:hypothetical protein